MNMLLTLLVCPDCKSPFRETNLPVWRCDKCGCEVPIQDGKPIFTAIPEKIQPFETVERGPEKGTPWRQANWKFLENEIKKLPTDALILEIGAGHGDFAQIFTERRYLSLDIIPYPEVDLVCDMTCCVPFRQDSFDMLVLMNVLEHVYNFHKLLDVLHDLLKPGGRLVITVPFMIKIHQAPFDFHRHTHFALAQMAQEHGFKVTLMEGYYDPIFFMGESIRNFRFWVFPQMERLKRWPARAILGFIERLALLIQPLVGKGYVKTPDQARNPAAIGYHLVLKKPA